jgi:quercetin dioxygenase-like cupin family protein
MTIMSPGQVHEPHQHELSEELIYVVNGSGEARIGGEVVTITAGNILSLARNEEHQFKNTGTEELRMLWIYSPSGAEIRFAD